MRHAYKSGAAVAEPSAADAASVGHASEGDILNGIDATIPGPYWFHGVTAEIVNVILEANIVPTSDLDQLTAAINSLISTAIAAIVVPDGVTLATNNEHLSNNPPNDEAATPSGVAARITRDISNLIDSSPGALDTLNELAAALGDDANFSATVNAALAARAQLAGATFTGRARGLTRPDGDSGTDFATTQFVANLTPRSLYKPAVSIAINASTVFQAMRILPRFWHRSRSELAGRLHSYSTFGCVRSKRNIPKVQ